MTIAASALSMLSTITFAALQMRNLRHAGSRMCLRLTVGKWQSWTREPHANFENLLGLVSSWKEPVSVCGRQQWSVSRRKGRETGGARERAWERAWEKAGRTVGLSPDIHAGRLKASPLGAGGPLLDQILGKADGFNLRIRRKTMMRKSSSLLQ